MCIWTNDNSIPATHLNLPLQPWFITIDCYSTTSVLNSCPTRLLGGRTCYLTFLDRWNYILLPFISLIECNSCSFEYANSKILEPCLDCICCGYTAAIILGNKFNILASWLEWKHNFILVIIWFASWFVPVCYSYCSHDIYGLLAHVNTT
jgi:hypothetical protein